MSNTNKKPQELKGDLAATEVKTTAMTIVKSEKGEPKPQTLKERMTAVNALHKKTVVLNSLKTNLQDLENLNTKTDDVDLTVSLKDENGNRWHTNNIFLLEKVKETLVTEFNSKIKEVEEEILNASI